MFRDSFRSHLPRISDTAGSAPRRRVLRLAAIALLPVATLLIAVLEAPPLAIPDASPLYLIAVTGIAVALGTIAAVLAAVASFLLYDALYVEPRYNQSAKRLRTMLLGRRHTVIVNVPYRREDPDADAPLVSRSSAPGIGQAPRS